MNSNISDLKIKLFYLASVISIFGHSANLLMENVGHVFIADAITTILAVFLIVLSWYKKIPVNLANGILIYVILSNMLISVLYSINIADIDGLLFLTVVTYLALVLYAGFTLHHRHLIIIGCIYLIFYLIITYYSNNHLVRSNNILVFVIIVGFSVGVHLIVQLLNRYNDYQIELIENLKKRNILLRKQGTELSNLNSTKDKLFSIIAHDLKTPINSIMGFSDLISMKAEKIESKSINEFSKHIYQSSNMLNLLLDQLLDWARIQTGKVSINIQSVKISYKVNEVIDLMKGVTYFKNITFDRPLKSDISIECDEQMVLTVIRNLVANALKFTPNNGKIVIKSEISEHNYIFSIKDSGVGMDETTLKRLFKNKPIDSKNGTNKEKGTGLGLVICNEYINLHRGEIWAESEPGVGSTFYFTIPLA